MNAVIVNHLTDLGDSGFAAALAGAVAVYLALSGARRQAAAILVMTALAATTIAIAKFAVFGCHAAFAPWHIASPSGHAAVATAVYGSCALVVAQPLAPARRWPIYLAALLLVALIAWSRLALHAHSAPEIAVGLAVGFLCCLCGWHMMRAAPPARLHPLGTLIAIAAATLLFYGNRAGVEGCLQIMAVRASRFMGSCF